MLYAAIDLCRVTCIPTESGTPEFFRSVVADALKEWFVRRGMPAASHIEGTNLAIAPFPMGAALWAHWYSIEPSLLCFHFGCR